MNFGSGMRLPNNNFGNSNLGNNLNNRGFSNNYSGINSNISSNSFNKVNSVKEPTQTYKSLDGTKWASYDQAMAHNKKIYNGEVAFKSNNYK